MITLSECSPDFTQKCLPLDKRVSLKPLKAQVGGHVYMKLLNDNHVCKPLNDREVKFYKNTPKNLLQLVPKYLGTVQIQQQQQQQDVGGSRDTGGGMTPATEYIVLENLTIDYNKPCILDLKMGTRHYSDFASEAKRKSQKKKSKKTTSGKLGIRFCGSQRFSYTQGNFETLDKYVGREADESELKTLLKKFFTCGGALRTEVIEAILEKIVNMREILLGLHQYRFYSSSLLIIYEGKPGKDGGHCEEADNSMDCEQFDQALGGVTDKNIYKKLKQDNVKVTMKIIDFANVSQPVLDEDMSWTQDSSHHEGPDDGFILGLDNLYQILQALTEEEEHFFL